MEFDDVILYDFFDNSLATATDWRAILHAERRGKLFDEKRHAILRTELKVLYVGLTHARECVWIWDQSTKGVDLETLLIALDLATMHDIAEAVPQIGVTSSSHDWSQRAQQYFSKGLFLEAALSFKNAGMDWWESVAKIYSERQARMRLPQQHQRLQSSFTGVAQEFECLAECPKALKTPNTRFHLFLNTGECYAAASNCGASANTFIKGQKYTEAAYQYRMEGSFEKAIDVINRYTVDPEVAESIKQAAKVEYSKRGDMSSLRKASNLFSAKDDFLKFLENNGFDEQRIRFLEGLEEYERVGDIHRQKGSYILAVRQFRRATPHPRTEKPQHTAKFAQDEQDEANLLRAVSELNPTALKEHGLRCIQSGNTLHALLALDSWTCSDIIRTLPSASDVEAAEILITCLKLSSVINTLARTSKLLDKPASRSLFCVTFANAAGPRHSETVSVKRHSFIYNSLNGTTSNRRGAVNKATQGTYLRSVVEEEIRRSLCARLNGVISRIDTLAQQSRSYELCISFVTTGKCLEMDQGLCWRDHPSDAELTVPKFNSRFRLHILTIALLDQPKYEQLDVHKIARAAKQRVFQALRPADGPRDFLSNILRTSLLATAFDYTFAVSYLRQGQWTQDQQFAITHGLGIPATNRPLAGAALPWLVKNTPERTDLGVYFLERVAGGDVWLDTDVAIGFVEEVCAQLIFNEGAHRPEGRECLTMPRSWIIRAFLRGASPKPNGSVPSRLVSLLGKFADILLLREHKYRCRLQVEGAPLTDPQSHITRYHGLVRLSRCLALVGHNIPPLREMVLSIFRGLDNSCPDIQLYSSCLSWVDVVKALKATSSSLDEMFCITWKDNAAGEDYELRTILYSGEKSLMEELSLVRTATVPVSVVTVDAEQPASQSEPVTSVSQMEQTHEASPETAPPAIPDDTELLHKSARTIQAFFRHHHKRANPSPGTASEEVAKEPVGMQTSDSGKDQTRDETPRKAAKLRLIKEPSSQAYSEQESNFPLSAPDIEPSRKSISKLVQSLLTFVEMPEAIYNELGIESLLSDRAL
ncbi:hypothetical protein FS837_007753 [Tulasnella sp. UAMH 9824]|nr:hypothetical protein FS837_007753 [Tulasnella sp. UAMH 9824]